MAWITSFFYIFIFWTFISLDRDGAEREVRERREREKERESKRRMKQHQTGIEPQKKDNENGYINTQRRRPHRTLTSSPTVHNEHAQQAHVRKKKKPQT